MRKIAYFLAVLLLAGCAYKHRPVYNVDDAMPSWMKNVSQERVEELIVAAASLRNWKCQHVDSGHLTATQTQEKFSATVDIYFDRSHWRIVYHDSTGFGAENGEIHTHYNEWVHNLERDIEGRFASLAGGAQ